MDENEMKVIIEFIKYLESDKDKYSIDYKQMLSPYSYSKEINDFIEFYYDSLLFLNYNNVEERTKLQIKEIDEMSYDELRKYLCMLFTGERFSSGMIANSIKENKLLNVLKKLVSKQ